MHIYLKHPAYGSKVAIAEAEAQADEKNGWQRYEVAAVLKPKEPEKVVSITPEVRAKRKYTRRA